MRKNYKKVSFACIGLMFSIIGIKAQIVSDFEGVTLPTDSFFNGSDLSGTTSPTYFTSNFESGDATFTNIWDTTYGGPGFWSEEFVISSFTDSVTSGADNRYSSRAGQGNNSLTYLVSQNNSTIEFKDDARDTIVNSIFITNSTYAAISMRDGDGFAKQFGGASGDDPDWFLLTIKGLDTLGNLTTDSVNFYLADYRFSDNSQDFIVTDWQSVDLTSLGNVYGLHFILTSSDTGAFGINTPTFFCLDDILSSNSSLIDFEDLGLTTIDSVINGSDFSGTPNNFLYTSIITDGTAQYKNVWNDEYGIWSGGFAISNKTDTITSGFTNTYSARSGIGANNSQNFAVGKNNATIVLTDSAVNNTVSGVYITNNTYAANSMRDGDMFAKQFGGASGDDPDFFKLTIWGYSGGNITTDSVEFYLADYRFTDNSQDYIVKDWQWVSLTSLGAIDSVTFVLSSSDVGAFGMNTPAFFCIDNFNDQSVVSVEEIVDENTELSIYPNPTKEKFNLVIEKPIDQLMIIDITGKPIISEVNLLAGIHTIDVSHLKTGIYFIETITNNNIITARFIKQ